MNIPLVDLAAQHAEVADEIAAGWPTSSQLRRSSAVRQ